MLWEVIEVGRNPMELVEVKGVTKRAKKAVVLTVEQFYLILDLLPEPYRTMVLVAQCTGLRVEEILALPWENIHFETLEHAGGPRRRSRSSPVCEDRVFGR